MKKFAVIALALVLTAGMLTACRNRTVDDGTIPNPGTSESNGTTGDMIPMPDFGGDTNETDGGSNGSTGGNFGGSTDGSTGNGAGRHGNGGMIGRN